MRRLVSTYESDRAAGRTSVNATTDDRLISWNRGLLADLDRNRERVYKDESVRVGAYRPFMKQHVYFDRTLNDMVYRLPSLWPDTLPNVGIYINGAVPANDPAALMQADLPNLDTYGKGGQVLARYRYEPVADDETLSFGSDADIIDGYRRIDNITDEALARFAKAYPDLPITKDDIFFYVYGLLHSTVYRETYAADLKKMLPRIPMVRDFTGFAEAGRKLSELHLGYESVEPYPLEGLDVTLPPGADAYDIFAVGDKKMRFGKPTPEQKAAGERADRSVIAYNDRITLSGIPTDAYRYLLGSRSAIEWIIDRYYVKTDAKSGIVNDPNDWSREVGDPRYILDLLARIVTVSLETMRIVDNLPTLDVIEGA